MPQFADWNTIERMFTREGEDLYVREGSPVLVLGILAEDAYRIPSAQRLPFVVIDHQTAGMGCHRLELRAIPLRPRPLVLSAMQLIEMHWFGSNLGSLGTTLDEILYYRMQLRDLVHPEADCNHTHGYLEEGVYPLDLSLPVIRQLCEDELPDDLDSLLEFPNDISRALGSISRWKCFILAANSD